jgi:hypothetical protein
MLDWFARNVNDVEQGQDWRLDGAQHIEKLPFIERLIRAGRRHVYWKIGQNKSVNLVALQRMYLHCLQEKLLIDAARILNSVGEKEKSVESEDMRKLIDGVGKQLHTYCEPSSHAEVSKVVWLTRRFMIQVRQYETETTCANAAKAIAKYTPIPLCSPRTSCSSAF